MSINSVTLVGRAGKDPEIKYFESGTAVAQFSIATNRVIKREGEDDTDWHNIKIWGKGAQVAVDYVKKGHLVGIIGRIEYEKWIDRTSGEKRIKTVIVADRLQLLTSKKEAAAMGGSSQPEQREDDDEIPF